MLGTWGSFWLGYGMLTGLIASGRFTAPAGAFPEMAFWFVAVAAITCDGRLSLTIDVHPSIAADAEWVAAAMGRLVAELAV